MAISNIKATFPTTIENVWAIVTSLTDYSWRSDIDKIEVVNDTTFHKNILLLYIPQSYNLLYLF